MGVPDKLYTRHICSLCSTVLYVYHLFVSIMCIQSINILRIKYIWILYSKYLRATHVILDINISLYIIFIYIFIIYIIMYIYCTVIYILKILYFTVDHKRTGTVYSVSLSSAKSCYSKTSNIKLVIIFSSKNKNK